MSARTSPDGRLLSYIAPIEGSPNFFVAPVDNLEAAINLTPITGQGVEHIPGLAEALEARVSTGG